MEDTEYKDICMCKKCNTIFEFRDAKKVNIRKIASSIIFDYGCPNSGSSNYTHISNRWRLDYVNIT